MAHIGGLELALLGRRVAVLGMAHLRSACGAPPDGGCHRLQRAHRQSLRPDRQPARIGGWGIAKTARR